MSIENINIRLKEARKKKGFQQVDMAKRLEISRAGYSRMETGKVEITINRLIKIIDILDISLDWLIMGKDKEANQQHGLNFSDFGKYAGSVELLFNEMKNDMPTMHGVLSYFFNWKGKEAIENQKKQEKEKEQDNV